MSGIEEGIGVVFDEVLSGASSAAESVGSAIDEALQTVGGQIDSLVNSDGGGALDKLEGGSDGNGLLTTGPGNVGSSGGPMEGFQTPESPNAATPGAAAADPTLTSGPGNVGSGGGGIPGGAGPEAGGVPPPAPKANGLLGDMLANRGFVERNGNLIGGAVAGVGSGIGAYAKGQQEVKLQREKMAMYGRNYGGQGGGPVTVSPPRIPTKNGLLSDAAGMPSAAPGTSVSSAPGAAPIATAQGPARIKRFDTDFNGQWKMDPNTGHVDWVSEATPGSVA